MKISSSAALIVVDVQNGFVNHESEGALVPLARFLDRWFEARAGGPTMLTRFHNPPGSSWERLIHWSRLRESPEIDLHAALEPYVQRATIIDKESYTSLTAEARTLLDRHASDVVLLAGIATDGCVLKTAVDLFEASVTPVVLTDCCASHAGPEVHEMGLSLLSRFIGSDQLVPSTDIEFS